MEQSLEKLELALQKSKDNRIKYNTINSFFVQDYMEYIGFWVNQNGTRTINKNISHSKYEATQKKTLGV